MSAGVSIVQLFIPLFIFFICAIAIIFFIIRQNRSIIERARKIDPSVKTITEAHYVLHKDIAQSFGEKKDNNK